MKRLGIFLVPFALLFGGYASACGEDAVATNPEKLHLSVIASRETYAAGEWLEFKIEIRNVCDTAIALPADPERSMLACTVCPGGEYMKYKCLPPAPDCGEEYWKDRVRLNPGEKKTIVIKVPSFPEPGRYQMGYSLYLWACGEIPESFTLIAVSDRASFEIVRR
ncbi:MAG: hypothetical protein IPH48_17845 [bacterium]|nr:hypothetical protein [bacterium]